MLHFPAMSGNLLIVVLIVYCLELLIVVVAAFILLRSALFPRGRESRGIMERGLRLSGALLLCVGGFFLLKVVL